MPLLAGCSQGAVAIASMAESEKSTSFKAAWRPFLWIIAASALAHLWCLGSVFFLDDRVTFQNNPLIESGRFWEASVNAWTYGWYSLQLNLFGSGPMGIHLVNWLLHTSVACMLFVLARELLENSKKPQLALFAALLFVVHPLGSEIPNYARTQDLAWVTLFSLTASWQMLRLIRGGNWKNVIWLILAIVGAMLSKGPGLLHALMMVGAVGVAYLQPNQWQWLKRRKWIFIGVFAIAFLALYQLGRTTYSFDTNRYFSEPRYIGHAYTLARVFWEFGWRSVIPVCLSADHHIAETMIPLGAKFWQIPDHGAMWAAVAFLALTAISIFLTFRITTRLVGLCLFLYCATILFRVLYLVPEFMPEYRIYPGLPWFCLGAAVVLNGALKKFTNLQPRVPAAILIGIFIVLSAKRSFLWHNFDDLMGDVLKQYPTQARVVWELHNKDLLDENWQAIIKRQRTLWPEVARRFHAENAKLTPGRELPTGHFALAEVTCWGRYARALAATQGTALGLSEMARLEQYMRMLKLDPKAHAIHWNYFYQDKALLLERAGDLEAAAGVLRAQAEPGYTNRDLERIEKKLKR